MCSEHNWCPAAEAHSSKHGQLGLQLWTHNLASQRGPPARTIAQGTVARDPPYLHPSPTPPSLPPFLWRTGDPHTVCCWSVSACLVLPRQLLTPLPCHWPEAPLFQMFPTEPRSSQTLSIFLYKRKINCSHSRKPRGPTQVEGPITSIMCQGNSQCSVHACNRLRDEVGK